VKREEEIKKSDRSDCATSNGKLRGGQEDFRLTGRGGRTRGEDGNLTVREIELLEGKEAHRGEKKKMREFYSERLIRNNPKSSGRYVQLGNCFKKNVRDPTTE